MPVQLKIGWRKKKQQFHFLSFRRFCFFFCLSRWENNGKRGKFSFVRFDGQKLLSSNKTRQQKTRKIDFNDDELAFRVCVLDSFESSVFSDPFFPIYILCVIGTNSGKTRWGSEAFKCN